MPVEVVEDSFLLHLRPGLHSSPVLTLLSSTGEMVLVVPLVDTFQHLNILNTKYEGWYLELRILRCWSVASAGQQVPYEELMSWLGLFSHEEAQGSPGPDWIVRSMGDPCRLLHPN